MERSLGVRTQPTYSPEPKGPREYRRTLLSLARRRVIFIPLTVISLLMVWPLVWLVLLTLKTNTQIFTSPLSLPSGLYIQNYVDAFRSVNFPLYFGNTFLIAGTAVLVGISISILSSFALSRFRFRFRNFLYVYFLMGLAIPVFILLFPIFLITNRLGLSGTYPAIILPYIAAQISFNTLLFVGFLKSFPQELEDAAVVDGCGIIRLLVSVVVPILRPAIATAAVFDFIGAWNEYPMASILINHPSMDTVSMVAYAFQGIYTTNYAGMAAGVFIMVIPEVIVYVLFQKQIVHGMTAGAVKG